MTTGDKHDSNARGGHLAIAVSILLLAFAVFGWGLHSKLSLYHIRARASEATPIAKLLSERERPPDVAQHCDLNHDDLHCDLHGAALAATAILLPQYATQSREIAPRGEAPPLPPRTLASKGPSLRRPPPSLIA
jgi:hypothetical protein